MKIAKWENGNWCDVSIIEDHISMFGFDPHGYILIDNIDIEMDNRIGDCLECKRNGVLVAEHFCKINVLCEKELIGAELDLAVAKVLGHYDDDCFKPGIKNGICYAYIDEYKSDMPLEFSSNWEQGGPLIEQHRIDLTPTKIEGETYWWATVTKDNPTCDTSVMGPTVLIAAMRALVAFKTKG